MKMKQVACMMLAIVISLVVAWDPVRPGALVKQIGNMIVINQSVRVLLKFDNIGTVRENVKQIKQGVQMIKDKMVESKVENMSLHKKLHSIQLKVTKIENNFLNNKAKRAIGMAIAIGSLIGISATNIGMLADLYGRVNQVEHSVVQLESLHEETEDLKLTINQIITNLEQINIKTLPM